MTTTCSGELSGDAEEDDEISGDQEMSDTESEEASSEDETEDQVTFAGMALPLGDSRSEGEVNHTVDNGS